MAGFGPGELEILARAYDRALDALALSARDEAEAARAIVLQGILEAARAGERDERALAIAAMNKVASLRDGDFATSAQIGTTGRTAIGL